MAPRIQAAPGIKAAPVDQSAALERMMDMTKDWQKLGLSAAVWSNPAILERLVEMQAEWTRFLSERLQENLAIQGEFMGCTDPVAFREIQGRYLKTAFDQYCAEMGKLVRMQQSAFDSMMGQKSAD